MARQKSSLSERTACIVLALCGPLLFAACGGVPVSTGPVRQVVLLWLRHPGRADDRAQLLRAARSLRMMPGVLRVEGGRHLSGLPNDVDRSFDLGIEITFRDRAARARYEESAGPPDTMRRYLQPLVRRYRVLELATR